jgi:hypothetical protein
LTTSTTFLVDSNVPSHLPRQLTIRGSLQKSSLMSSPLEVAQKAKE